MAVEPKCTPQQAKVIFDQNPKVSKRDLALRCGVSRNTIHRWVANDWQDLRKVNVKARKRIKDNQQKRSSLVSDTIKSANIGIKQAALLEEMKAANAKTDDDLIREANRQVLCASIAILKEIANQGVRLVGESPQQIAALIAAVAGAVTGTTKAWDQVVSILAKLGAPEQMIKEASDALKEAEANKPPPEPLPDIEDDPALRDLANIMRRSSQH